MAKRQTSVEGLTGLWKVKNAKALLWPREFSPSTHRGRRGGPGYVVDLSQPYEKVFCRGQAFNLKEAPEASAPSPITNQTALRWMKAQRYLPRDYKVRRTVKDQIEERATKADAPSDLPGLDEAPGVKKPRKEKSDGVEGQGSPVEL